MRISLQIDFVNIVDLYAKIAVKHTICMIHAQRVGEIKVVQPTTKRFAVGWTVSGLISPLQPGNMQHIQHAPHQHEFISSIWSKRATTRKANEPKLNSISNLVRAARMPG